MASASILIVEDEKIVARGLQRDLESMGYTVPAIAASGEEALHQVAERPPDLVLMDVILKGGLDGIETSRRLRDRYRVPVIYLSAYEDDQTLRRARETEPYGYLLKPYEERELQATIEMALYKHQMERRLREAEQWLSATLCSVRDAVIATDERQQVRYLNPAAERLLGRARADVFEQPLGRVLPVECAGTPDVVGRVCEEIGHTGAPADLPEPAVLRGRGGAELPVEGTVSAIRDGDGHCTGYVWVVRDVSEGRRAEARRRAWEEQFRRLQEREAVSRLAGDVADDFQQLLTSILANTSLALCAAPERDSCLGPLLDVERAALQAVEQARRLSAFARQANPWRGPANVNAVVQKIWDHLRQLVEAPVTVVFRPAPDLWPVATDAGVLDELLTRLLIQVCNALPRGGRLTLETANVQLTDADTAEAAGRRAGAFVRLRLGVPADEAASLGRLFGGGQTEEAEDVMPSASFQELCDGVCRQQGWVEWRTEPNPGARLDVYWPRSHRDAEEPQPKPAAPASRERSPTVLLVDDEPLVRDVGQVVLERAGFRVLLARDGRQALQIYRDQRRDIDLVVLDMLMPHLSGDETFQQLLRLNPEVRVLFCSGGSAEQVQSLGEVGSAGFLAKPYRNDDLVRAVREALG